ncbi:abscisic acid receptor PYL2 [Amborella trichopoda]|uniref:Abscisic acid receptor PYL2 n=1 Tax=Amborella trichopoda TaxID=13333 RepID=U5CQ23_AMBTC|nr:abscisic acid receptor PYL2 [Amborella trichopoda]ERN15281.1 hypothetical protein AMTR_s00056p00227590 [Amborella trichopoda]|eukprot:XP_006853814.3 abscisic acid receptor PYL2 [Amborella trichopoda]
MEDAKNPKDQHTVHPPPSTSPMATKPSSSATAIDDEDEEANPPPGLTIEEYKELKPAIKTYHGSQLSPTAPEKCSSLIVQRINAPLRVVWPVVRSFDNPQKYKHFIKSCTVRGDVRVGTVREVTVISGLPASTSTERLEILDDDNHVMSFSVVGGEHRLKNYRSVTSVKEFRRENKVWTIVLESYVVDIPEGNTREDTRMFVDTVVKLNLQKLAVVAQNSAQEASGD